MSDALKSTILGVEAEPLSWDEFARATIWKDGFNLVLETHEQKPLIVVTNNGDDPVATYLGEVGEKLSFSFHLTWDAHTQIDFMVNFDHEVGFEVRFESVALPGLSAGYVPQARIPLDGWKIDKIERA